MHCEVDPCPVAGAHIHCEDCADPMLGEGGGGYDGRGIVGYLDSCDAYAKPCRSCDSMLCSICQKRANGACMLCIAEVAAENHRAVVAGKIYRDDRCACDHHARDPHCAKCGGLRRWIRAVA